MRKLVVAGVVVAQCVAAACFPSLAIDETARGGGDAAAGDATLGHEDDALPPGERDGGGGDDGATVVSTGWKPATIAVTASASCVLEAGGVRCWGSNSDGSLGRGLADASTAVQAAAPVVSTDGSALTDVRGIAGGRFNFCALVGAGTVVCWGDNHSGESGPGTKNIDRILTATPIKSMLRLPLMATITTGHYTGCATAADAATAYCWGQNNLAQKTSTIDYSEWVDEIPGLRGRAIGLELGGEHGCIVGDGGVPLCFGWNDQGQAGADTSKRCDENAPCVELPQAIAAVTGTRRLALGSAHSCAIDGAGDVRCWGSNARGQLGPAGPVGGASTSAVLAFRGATALAVGGDTSCALKSGEVHCWGKNDDALLGIGADDANPHPTATPVEREDGTENLTDVVEIAVGERHACARTSKSDVYCWGYAPDPSSAGADHGWIKRARKMEFR